MSIATDVASNSFNEDNEFTFKHCKKLFLEKEVIGTRTTAETKITTYVMHIKIHNSNAGSSVSDLEYQTPETEVFF